MIDWDIVLKIGLPLTALIVGAILKEVMERRASIQYYVGTLADFKFRGAPPDATSVSVEHRADADAVSTSVSQDFPVYTHALVIVNGGRAPAMNVRIGHLVLPQHYHVSPSLNFSIESVKDSGDDIVFPILRPKEQVTVSYLYFQALTPSQIHSYLKVR